MPRRVGTLSWLAALLSVVAALLLVAILVWWGPLREAAMDPGVPYLTYTPPEPPDYAQGSSWALLPVAKPARGADIFFIHPTTYEGRQWNGAIDAPEASALLSEVMLPNYAGPFDAVGRVFAPRYRQAGL